ncbi:uncharacterized protein LOC114174515 [Vigna unguiculata]|uniref:uncharacterized protein LOC114174515 n=1 Tax=Vigna unguiculata TaxID=3917 RepID=UPI001016271F|nr:uncharacterized protein LOC114174515 [Vigna unguiculata]
MTRDQNRPEEQKQARFSNYAPLNAPKSRILDEVLQAELIPPPRKFQNLPNADMSKYCHYHRNSGHMTEECETLRNKIEELIRASHLKHYVKNVGEGGSRPRYDITNNRRFERREERRPECKESRREPGRNQNVERRMEQQQQDKCLDDRPPLRRTINTISRGFVGGGHSSSFKKRHLRAVQSVHAIIGRSQRRMPPITFTNSNFKGTDPNQEDPMVIMVELESFAVKNVLVDPGSSVDILY